jgi:hypothetical protein
MNRSPAVAAVMVEQRVARMLRRVLRICWCWLSMEKRQSRVPRRQATSAIEFAQA